MDTIFHRLKAVREALRLNQKEVSTHTGISQQELHLLENGEKKFIHHTLIDFYVRLGVDARYFYDSLPYGDASSYLDSFNFKITQLRLRQSGIVKVLGGLAYKGYLSDKFHHVPLISLLDHEAYLKAPDRVKFLSSLPQLTVPFRSELSSTFCCFQLSLALMNQEIDKIPLYAFAARIHDFKLYKNYRYLLISDRIQFIYPSKDINAIKILNLNDGYQKNDQTHELWLIERVIK
ncbi:helix-turn-helix domain-containing protein [Roseivirga sp. BDSF3-8]|uniref:helix-turn-helix domain-containing protein n=1 Tax=Roseivirga sp. BDSF3-8 TaxID=3241598 RepID=UPI003531B9AC